MEGIKIQTEKVAAASGQERYVQSHGRSQEAPAAQQQQPPSPQPVEQVDLDVAVQELTQRYEVQVEVAQDETTGRDVVRIMSQDGERVLRQMPPSQVIKMAAAARRGALLNLLDSLV